MAIACAEIPVEVLKAREDAINSLKGFNPKTIMGDYTESPPEALITVSENNNPLGQLGHARAAHNDTASTIFSQAKKPHLKANPNALERQYAETLLSHADSVIKGACYEEPAHCQMDFVTKMCEDKTNYREERCESTLAVVYKTTTQAVNRYLFYENKPGQEKLRKTIHLSVCDSETPPPLCSANNLISVSPQCVHLDVFITQGAIPLAVLKAPNCQDPTVTFDLLWDESAFGGTVTIAALESQFEERWTEANCSFYDAKVKEGTCVLNASNLCLEPNTTRVIDGILITRPCWGKATTYQCVDGMVSDCDKLLAEGCSQVESQCSLATDKRCDVFLQTFRCPVNQCFPKQTICPNALHCAKGECDKTTDELSTDVAEGLTRLGALAGAAADVSLHQINASEPAIFKGHAKHCESYPLGIHDCCRDKGWGKWAIQCPSDLQALLKAKQAKRVRKVGHYTKHFIKHYVYCVFPSMLASIVQIQGRFGQLHIDFGKPKSPDCRGITPEELERIQFDALDLSLLTDEFKNRQTLPDKQILSAKSEAKISQFYQAGQAHD